MLVLLLAGMHITIVLGISGLLFLFLFYGGFTAITVAATKTASTLDSFTLTAVPLFILMSEVLFHAGIGRSLFDAVSKWLGFLRGGLAMASIGACAIFAAMCGSSTATTATIGLNAIPEMRRHNYPLRLAVGSVAASGGLGILIPPSIVMIVYGAMAEEPVAKLFMAGMVPGIVLALLLMLYVYLVPARKGPAAVKIHSSWKEKFLSLRRIWPAVVLIVCVLGGIYAGIMTPTEAAGVGVIASMVVAGIVGGLNWAILKASLISAAKVSCMLLIIIASAYVFGYVLSRLQFPTALCSFVASLGVNRWVVVILINLLLIVLGCVMDGLSMLVVTLPIFYPLIIGLGFDPIWLGVVYTMNLEIAVITPPIGMNLFVARGLIGEEGTLGDVIWGSAPFAGIIAAGLAIIIAFPQIALFLPNLMYG